MKNTFVCIGLISLLAASFSIRIKAEERVVSGSIPIAVVTARQQNIPEGTSLALENKLLQLVSMNGLGSADYYGRFVITASMVPVTKDILPGPPKKFSENIDVTFYIIDNIDQKIFSSLTVSAKAVDSSEEKVLNKAVRSINVKSPRIKVFVDEGRNKIVSYYINQAERIIATAKAYAQQKRYEEAFYELNAIPQACGSAYDKAVKAGTEIYQEYVNYVGEVNLAKARSAWMAQQNKYGAAEAGQYLSKILPDAQCYGRAEDLYKEIKSKVLSDWEFEMTMYKDDVSIELAQIEAWKQIGVAYGKNQKSDHYNITWLVR